MHCARYAKQDETFKPSQVAWCETTIPNRIRNFKVCLQTFASCLVWNHNPKSEPREKGILWYARHFSLPPKSLLHPVVLNFWQASSVLQLANYVAVQGDVTVESLCFGSAESLREWDWRSYGLTGII